MVHIKRGLLWLWLLTKRLYKKSTFLVLLALIPLLVLGYSTVARDDSGVAAIALASFDKNDTLAQSIIADLTESDIITFRICDTPEEARRLVRTGRVDAAWIFADNLEERVCQFIQKPLRKNAFVEVLERESNIAIKLSREKLSGTVFAHCSPYIYLNYVREELPELADVSDAELLSHYEGIKLSGRLFEFSSVDGANAEEVLEANDYLVSPVRGILAVVVMLCGLAGAMYALQDEKRGTFGWLPEKKRPLVELAGQIVCVTNAAVVMLLSLVLFSVNQSWTKEILALAEYILAVSAFSMLFKRLCRQLKHLCMWAPILVVVMLIVCPVFFDLGPLHEVQLLFPPTYYVSGMFNYRYLLWAPLYIAACFSLCALFDWFARNRKAAA